MEILSKEDIKKGLKTVLKTDFSNYSPDEIHDCILQNLSLIPYRNLVIGDSSGASFLPVYRARNAEDIDGKLDNTLTRTFSYPPPKFASRNRFNVEGLPVFYGSDSFESALMELKTIKPSDEYYIGIWDVFHESPFMMNILLHSNLPEENLWITVARNSKKKFIKVINEERKKNKQKELNSSEKKSLSYLIDAFGDLLISSNIFASSAIGYDLFYKIPFSHPEFLSPILVYPGIESNMLHSNLAIHPAFVNSSMKLSCVYKLAHKIDNSNYLTGGIIAKGFVDGKQILWKKPFLTVSDNIEVIGIVSQDGIKHEKKNTNPFNFHIKGKQTQIIDNLKKIASKETITEALYNMIQQEGEVFHLTKENEEKTDKVIVVEYKDGLFLNNEIPVRAVAFLVKYYIDYE